MTDRVPDPAPIPDPMPAPVPAPEPAPEPSPTPAPLPSADPLDGMDPASLSDSDRLIYAQVLAMRAGHALAVAQTTATENATAAQALLANANAALAMSQTAIAQAYTAQAQALNDPLNIALNIASGAATASGIDTPAERAKFAASCIALALELQRQATTMQAG